MKMYLATYELNQEEKIGVVLDDCIVPIERLIEGTVPQTMVELIDLWDDAIEKQLRKAEQNSQDAISINTVKLLAPIPSPSRGIICLGKNYLDHVKEVDSGVVSLQDGAPIEPIYFCKFVDRAIGHGESIPLHENVTTALDYEVELAVIVGKEGKDIPIDEVEEYIFGYTILNDVSARDVQKRHTQWFKGKSLDGTCPMGPYILLKDDISFPPKLKLRATVNGEIRQESYTDQMIFSISQVISGFSKGTTLRRGDIISTGTPSGVGMGFNPKKTLKSGDAVRCEIEKIGVLENIVR